MSTTKNSFKKITIKAFDRNFKYDGVQYEVGKTYRTKKMVSSFRGEGFRAACGNPIGAFLHQNPPARFAIVEQSGFISEDIEKFYSSYSSSIKIIKEISLDELSILAESHVPLEGDVSPLYKDYKVYTAEPDKQHVRALFACSVAAGTAEKFLSVTSDIYSVAAVSAPRSLAKVERHSSVAAASSLQSVAFAKKSDSIAATCGMASTSFVYGKESAAVNVGGFSRAEVFGESGIALSVGPYSAAIANCSNSVAASIGAKSLAKGVKDSFLFWLIWMMMIKLLRLGRERLAKMASSQTHITIFLKMANQKFSGEKAVTK